MGRWKSGGHFAGDPPDPITGTDILSGFRVTATVYEGPETFGTGG